MPTFTVYFFIRWGARCHVQCFLWTQWKNISNWSSLDWGHYYLCNVYI